MIMPGIAFGFQDKMVVGGMTSSGLSFGGAWLRFTSGL